MDILFLHQPIRVSKPPKNIKTLSIIDHIKTSELLKNVFVKDNLNKIKDARINKTPIVIGCLVVK
jgi:hypothetical protein